MTTGCKYCFLISITLVASAYNGYAQVLSCCSRLFGAMTQDDQRRATTSVSALDEEEVIGARVANALAQDYPADRLEFRL